MIHLERTAMFTPILLLIFATNNKAKTERSSFEEHLNYFSINIVRHRSHQLHHYNNHFAIDGFR